MIIGFAGKAASGKTTAARYLAERLPGQVEILPMAQVLRGEVEEFIREVGAEQHVPLIYGDQEDKVRVFYVNRKKACELCPAWKDFIEMNWDIQDKTSETAVSVRLILQWWGTEYRRAQDPDYWTKAWEKQVQKLDLDHLHVLVDDVRFANELDVISRNGGRFVRIIRPGFDGANNHSSENSLDDYDGWELVIDNDGTLEQFKEKVAELLLPLLAGE